jgi:ParB/RepB/Spo0J family partition protein
MSMKLNAGDVRKSDLFLIDPAEIVVDAAANGRASGHTDEEIEALAASILEYGQQQPCVVRRIAENRVQLVSGYGRYRAVSLVNSRQPDNQIPLRCTATVCNDEEAFLRNLVENNDRKSTTPIDDAHNQRRLREVFGWDDERIKKFYGRSITHLRQLEKLLTLDNETQAKVSGKKMSVQTALDLAELHQPERKATLEEATHPETGAVNGQTVRKVVREKAQATGGKKPRTLAEVRNYFDDLSGGDGPEKTFCKTIVDFIAGKIGERKMKSALEELTRTQPVEAD